MGSSASSTPHPTPPQSATPSAAARGNDTGRSSSMSSSRRTNRDTGFQEVELSDDTSGDQKKMSSSSSSDMRSAAPSRAERQCPPPPSEESSAARKSDRPVAGAPSSNTSRVQDVAPSRAPQRPAEPKNDSRNTVDRSAVVGRIQREKTMAQMQQRGEKNDGGSQFHVPQYQDDDIHFETFYHMDGKEFRCMCRQRKRYIIDVEERTQHPFPEMFYNQGLLVTDELPSAQQRARGNAVADNSNSLSSAMNDRDGYIDHPTLGRLQTSLLERKQNVHLYYDKISGEMIPLPLSFELLSPTVKTLMAPIEETLPNWQDKYDMLAALRVSNYDPELCISTYLNVGETGVSSHPTNAADANLLADKENTIRDLQNQINILKEKLARSTETYEAEVVARRAAEEKSNLLQDRASSTEADLALTVAKLEALQRDRPKTAASRRPAPVVLDPDTLASVNNNTRRLHKAQIQLAMQAKEVFGSLRNMISEVSVNFDKMRQCDSGTSRELEEMKELYRREALQRKLLYNELQELRGNIRVFFRCRYDSRTKCCIQFPSDTDVVTPNAKKPYTFDKVFTPQSTQEEVYNDTKPIITSCVDGYNVCILAYGQTGSGKTYTMQGPSNDPGVNVRSLMDLLDICQGRDNVEFSLKASMVEIYNESVHDLLNANINTLDIRAQGNRIVLPGMVEMAIESMDNINEIMKLGQKNRATASTKMNSESSRSHLIFMVTVQGRDKSTGATSTGTLTLCDLAGSERVSKTEATGQRLVEAAAINKSLSSLGQVFTALRTGQLHIPYRNSKLTHILQPSLGGDAKACLFVMTSPDVNNLSETTSTIQFGSNAQQVQLGQAKKNVTKG